MKTIKKLLVVKLFSITILILGACQEDEEQVSNIQFETQSTTVNEDEGTIDIVISSTNAVASDIEVDFQVTGTAYLNGDYRLETASPVTIKAGSSSAVITIAIIDEEIIETEDDEITIEIVSVSTGASASADKNNLEHTIAINDNDIVIDDELQMDLTWDIGENADIDQVNFDVYLATNVVIDGEVVTDATMYAVSENTLGFETLNLTADDPDDEYYVVIYYNEGNLDGEYFLNFNGMGFENELVTNAFTSEDSGYAIFFGPLYKSGTSLGRQKQPARFNPSRLDFDKFNTTSFTSDRRYQALIHP